MSRGRRNTALVVAFMAVWAMLATSCGSTEVTKAEYGKQLRSAMAELEDAYGDTAAATTPAAGGDAGTATPRTVDDLRSSQLALRDAANRLDAITPPAELANDHDALVQGVRDMADAVDLLIEAQQQAESNPEQAKKLARQFASDDSFGTVEAAASRIQSAGVDAGL
ncbi:MAG: hypothetical protein KDC46_12195 [Thermoleophilia bacterium]|nr:hypothetical protein [Thermoleophilia bacterium]